MREIGIFLRKNNTMKLLDISSCKMHDNGFNLVARGIKYNNSLESLIIEDNLLHDESALSLLEACLSNDVLKRIRAKMNIINFEIIEKINLKLYTNGCLKNMNSMNIYPKKIKMIKDELFVNQNIESELKKIISEKNNLEKKLEQEYKELNELQNLEDPKEKINQTKAENIQQSIEKIDEEIVIVENQSQKINKKFNLKYDILNRKLLEEITKINSRQNEYNEFQEKYNQAQKNMRHNLASLEECLNQSRDKLYIYIGMNQ